MIHNELNVGPVHEEHKISGGTNNEQCHCFAPDVGAGFHAGQISAARGVFPDQSRWQVQSFCS